MPNTVDSRYLNKSTSSISRIIFNLLGKTCFKIVLRLHFTSISWRDTKVQEVEIYLCVSKFSLLVETSTYIHFPTYRWMISGPVSVCLSNLKKGSNIPCKKVCCESAAVENNVYEEWKDSLRYILRDYDVKNCTSSASLINHIRGKMSWWQT